MWQRIQTVFLVFVIVFNVATILLPIWVFNGGTENAHELYALHYTEKTNGERVTQYFPYSITAIFAVASATMAFFSIRNFKNRILQLKLGALNSLFLLGVAGPAVYFASQLAQSHQGGQYGLGLWLPIGAVVCNSMANWFIRKDERMVRDSDRLR
ncbi:MAG: DUF4293 domain-containing protein [Flammeovirgaceae bacterium]|nr:DUF4293 domain-containing protein [Flammeovirgaceae bacterium]